VLREGVLEKICQKKKKNRIKEVKEGNNVIILEEKTFALGAVGEISCFL